MKWKLVLILAILSMSVVHAAPITNYLGDRIHVNFMYQDPDPVGAGKDLDLRWQIINTIPQDTVNLKFYLDVEYPFYFDGIDKPERDLGKVVGTGDNEVYYILHYKLRVADNALKGTYNVTLRWSIGNGWTEKEFPIYVDPKNAKLVIGALVTSPEKLIADTDDAKLSVDIENIGDGNAENVKVKLILPDGFKPTYSYSDEDSLGTIMSNSGKQATFFVDTDENLSEGEYLANLEISYKDEKDENNVYKKKTLDLKIPIKPAPHLIIYSVKSIPEKIMPGDKVELIITVKNNGNEKSDSTSLRVFKDTTQPFDFSEKSDFVGNLDPGETGDAGIKFTVDSSALPKKYLLDVEIRGIDNKKNVVTFDRTVPVIVSNGEKASPSNGFVSVILVIGLAGYMIYKRKKS